MFNGVVCLQTIVTAIVNVLVIPGQSHPAGGNLESSPPAINEDLPAGHRLVTRPGRAFVAVGVFRIVFRLTFQVARAGEDVCCDSIILERFIERFGSIVRLINRMGGIIFDPGILVSVVRNP